MAEWCTKQSFSPFAGVMKPKPLVSLNHFTVPVVRIANSPDDDVQAGMNSVRTGLHVARERHPHAGARPADTALCRTSSDAGEKKGPAGSRSSSVGTDHPYRSTGVRRWTE